MGGLARLGRFAEAEALYRPRAEAGDVVAQYELAALLHVQGKGPAPTPRRPRL